MGVWGLTTYIAENSKLYMKPYELHNSYLVVDGNNIASHTFKWMTKSDGAFGGDYDEYYSIVKHFFLMLKKCKVTPIVLFDGGYEKRKIKTVLHRAGMNLSMLRKFSSGFSSTKFFPLFAKQVFFDVMEDLEIFCVQCHLEADIELAAVARALNCPVLSYDSDFYIFDVLYIPFSSVYSEPVKFENSHDYYVRCLIYDVRSFLSSFPGLDKSLLPVVATLLGNDYIQSSMFEKFFGHVIMPKNKNKSYTQRKIHGVLHWIKKENVESAVKLILSHLEAKNSVKVLRAIKTSINDYTSIDVSEPVLNQLTAQMGNLSLNKKHFQINLPPEVYKVYYQCKVHKFIIDIIILRVYFTQLQVEEVTHLSSHFPSLQLIRNIDALLYPYVKGDPKPLKVYLTLKNHYTAIKLEKDPSNFLFNVFLHEILKESKEERLKWLCSIVGVDDDDLNIVSNDSWTIFLMSFIYWIKKLNDSVTLAHIHALVLMAIANQVVQKDIGYFRNYSKFMKNKGHLLEKLKAIPIATSDCNDFAEMLAGVTFYEKLIVQNTLIPYRQTSDKGRSKAYCISALHLFGCFQSCLFHIMQINALLNYPLPHLKISDFYSGTLLFNFYLIIRTKLHINKFGCNLFKGAPNLAKLYVYLSESLCKFSVKVSASVKKHRKRKNNKNIASHEIKDNCNEEIIVCADEDDSDNDDYTDENNPYSILKNCSGALY